MIVQALTLAPALFIVDHIRPRDAEEVLSLRTDDNLHAWALEVVGSPGFNWAFFDDDRIPVAMGGWIRSEEPGVLISWLVATDQIKRIGVALHRFGLRGHRLLASTGASFRTLGLEYDEGRRWLERLGYRQGPTLAGAARGGKDLVWMERGHG